MKVRRSYLDEAVDRVNLHIYPSPFTHESRILKETKSMADAGLVNHVFLIGIWDEGLPETEQLDPKRQIWRIKPSIGSQQSGLLIKTLRYLEWQWKIYSRFKKSPVKYINCHSLPVLPIGVFFKIFKRATLIYDTHELETESIGSVGFKRLLYKLVEGSLIHFVDAVITVSESISEWYRNTYQLNNVASVRNIPYRSEYITATKDRYFQQKYQLNDEDILFIFQGYFSPGRGIELLLNVFSEIDRSKHVVFMGLGGLEKTIIEYESRHSNIHFHPAVSPQEVGKYTRGADVGLCLQENIGLNYYLTIPNKIFEYIMNGVPAIVSDFPELARIVDEGRCGWKVPVDREALSKMIINISREEITEMRENALTYRENLGWQNEEVKLLKVYQDL